MHDDTGTCVEGLQRVIDAGARLLLLNPVFGELSQLACFAEHLAPKL